MAEQAVRGGRQLEVPRRRSPPELGAGGHGAAGPSRGSGAAAAAGRAAGPEGRGGGAARGRRAKLGRELRAAIAVQEQGREIFTRACEEKLGRHRELLPRLREAVREDARALRLVRKTQLSSAAACGAQNRSGVPLVGRAAEVVQEKLQAQIFALVKKNNLLLHQVRQRSRARDELQRQLQQLQEAAREDKRQRAQAQAIRQLQNKIEKMQSKAHAAQEVTARYLAVRDALKKELVHLRPHLDLLSRMTELYQKELDDMELMASDALKAAQITKRDMARMGRQVHAESELRAQSLAAKKVPSTRPWVKEVLQKQPRALAMGFPSLHGEDSLADKLEATKARLERDAALSEKLERAKAAVQCSRLWDIPSGLLTHQMSSVDLEQHVRVCEEKQQELQETLKELELRRDELKFHQPPDTTRVLEEELRRNLQQEGARLQEMRAQMLRNQEVLFEFEMNMDSLLARLHGITVPGQEDSVRAEGVQEKLQCCRQKLRYLVQRVANLPPHSHSPSEDNKTFVKLRKLLEKRTADDPLNVKVSWEDTGSSVQERFDFADPDTGLVLTREDIKKQGQLLIEANRKRKKM